MEGNVESAIVRLEERLAAMEKRMDGLQKLIDTVQELALGIRDLTNRTKTTEDKLENIGKKVDELEGKPAKYWSSVVTAVISALVGAAIAYFIKGGQ